ncbi:MAG: sugar phosphate isomerase/epimerase family protein [Kiritimatiellia bacterium]
MNRREFIFDSAAAAAVLGLAGCRNPPRGGVSRPIALQLWSINKIFWQNPERHLAEIKAAGYDGVEFAGYDRRPAKALRKMLADAGLRAAGTHISGMDNYRGDGLKRNLDFCAEAGIEALGNSWFDADRKEDWIRFGEEMGVAAETAATWNLPVQVHNHVQEFKKTYDGVLAWDLIFTKSSPRLLQQIDTSQVINPGGDVVATLKNYPNRHFSIHMKENVPSKDGYFGVAPDDGGKIVPWKDTVDYIETEPGFAWYVIECERRPDSLEPAIYNLGFLKKLV